MKGFRKCFILLISMIMFQQCVDKKQDQAAILKIEKDSTIIANNLPPQVSTNVEPGITISPDSSNKTWEIEYSLKKGDELSKILKDNHANKMSFLLVTNGINSYFYFNTIIENSNEVGQNKNINKFNTASEYRIFKQNSITYGINILGTNIYYYKPANESWKIDNDQNFTIKGFTCKKATSQKFGIAYFKPDKNISKRGGPNGIGDLPGFVVKLITPEKDEFLLKAAKESKRHVSVPASLPIPADKLNDAINKIVEDKNKSNQKANSNIETKVTVSYSN